MAASDANLPLWIPVLYSVVIAKEPPSAYYLNSLLLTLTFPPLFGSLAGRRWCSRLSLNLAKSFELLFHNSLLPKKSTSTHSSQLLKKKEKETPRRGNSDRPLIPCYNCALFHTRTITHSDTVATLYSCLILLSATLLFPLSRVGLRYLAQGHLYGRC